MEKDELIFGAIFHPYDDDIFVTYGSKHLNIWQLNEEFTGILHKSPLKVTRVVSRKRSKF